MALSRGVRLTLPSYHPCYLVITPVELGLWLCRAECACRYLAITPCRARAVALPHTLRLGMGLGLGLGLGLRLSLSLSLSLSLCLSLSLSLSLRLCLKSSPSLRLSPSPSPSLSRRFTTGRCHLRLKQPAEARHPRVSCRKYIYYRKSSVLHCLLLVLVLTVLTILTSHTYYTNKLTIRTIPAIVCLPNLLTNHTHLPGAP